MSNDTLKCVINSQDLNNNKNTDIAVFNIKTESENSVIINIGDIDVGKNQEHLTHEHTHSDERKEGLAEANENKRHRNRIGKDFLVYYETSGQTQASQGEDSTFPQSQPLGTPLVTDETSERNRFVLKVLAVLLVMLLITAIASFFIVNAKIKMFRNKLSWIFVCGALIIMSLIQCCMGCFNYCRQMPGNVVAIVFVTICGVIACGVMSGFFDTQLVLYAVGITAVVVLVLMGLALTPIDFTKFYLFFIVASLALLALSLLVLGISLIFNIKLTWLQIGILIAATLLNCFSILMEMQMILGGRTMELGEDDWAYGAVSLYSSIVTLFIQILSLLQHIF